MRILFVWCGWLPRYEHTKEYVSTAFYHKRLYLWFVCIQWAHNESPPITLNELLEDYAKDINRHKGR